MALQSRPKENTIVNTQARDDLWRPVRTVIMRMGAPRARERLSRKQSVARGENREDPAKIGICCRFVKKTLQEANREWKLRVNEANLW
jgi:hypothetical protein